MDDLHLRPNEEFRTILTGTRIEKRPPSHPLADEGKFVEELQDLNGISAVRPHVPLQAHKPNQNQKPYPPPADDPDEDQDQSFFYSKEGSKMKERDDRQNSMT
jgi:hypothetical protein